MRKVMMLTKRDLQSLPPLYEQDGRGFQSTVHVKWFSILSGHVWLITEYDPNTRIAFGWADDRRGGGELGYVSLTELESVKGPLGIQGVERDRYFKPAPLGEAIKAEGLQPPLGFGS